MTTPNNNNNSDGNHFKKPAQPISQNGLTITYDADSGTYDVTNDQDLPLTVTIIQAIATLTEIDPHALEPLANHIDPDHLEGLFNPDHPVRAQSPTVSFTYAGCHITVESLTEMTLTP